MILTGKTKVLGSESCVSATSSTTDAWMGMESNGDFRGETQSSNRLNNGATVKSKIFCRLLYDTVQFGRFRRHQLYPWTDACITARARRNKIVCSPWDPVPGFGIARYKLLNICNLREMLNCV